MHIKKMKGHQENEGAREKRRVCRPNRNLEAKWVWNPALLMRRGALLPVGEASAAYPERAAVPLSPVTPSGGSVFALGTPRSPTDADEDDGGLVAVSTPGGETERSIVHSATPGLAPDGAGTGDSEDAAPPLKHIEPHVALQDDARFP